MDCVKLQRQMPCTSSWFTNRNVFGGDSRLLRLETPIKSLRSVEQWLEADLTAGMRGTWEQLPRDRCRAGSEIA